MQHIHATTPVHLDTSIPTYPCASIPACLHTYLPSHTFLCWYVLYLHASRPAHLPTCLPTYLYHAHLDAYFAAAHHACHHTYKPTNLHACMYLRACIHTLMMIMMMPTMTGATPNIIALGAYHYAGDYGQISNQDGGMQGFPSSNFLDKCTLIDDLGQSTCSAPWILRMTVS